MTQGEEGDTFYIIEEGSVRCTQAKADGREVELVTLKSGDFFGEMALMLNETRYVCVCVCGYDYDIYTYYYYYYHHYHHYNDYLGLPLVLLLVLLKRLHYLVTISICY